MQVRVYVVRTECGWHPGITLDWRVDVGYWLEGEGSQARGTKLVFLRQVVPIQIGMAMLERFVAVEEMGQWGKSSWIHYFAKLLAPCTTELKEEARILLLEENLDVIIMGPSYSEPSSSLFMMEKPIAYRVTESAVGYSVEKQDRHTAKEVFAKLPAHGKHRGTLPGSIYVEAYWLAYALRGRLLLDEELIQLMQNIGCSDWIDSRCALLQCSWLHDWLELRTGVAYKRKKTGSVQGKMLHREFRFKRGTCSPRQADVTICCGRCGSVDGLRRSRCATCCSTQCLTCTKCLNLGRCRSCAILIAGKLHQGGAQAFTFIRDAQERLAQWKLSPAQADASFKALDYMAKVRRHFRQQGTAMASKRDEGRRYMGRKRHVKLSFDKGSFLLWAVTGAGKTEMTFPLVEDTLLHGGRALIATPRRDVVLELKPRMIKAFSNHRVVALYGGSPQRWEEGEITLATTHQLLRFEGAFDLVIIDELDAFPYHNDPMLQGAAKRACSSGGVFIFLSATPPEKMQQDVRRGRLACAMVPVRFHRYPLPLPIRVNMTPVARCLSSHKLPSALLVKMRQSVNRGAQLFIFIARIHQVKTMVRFLREHLPGVAIDGTSAADEGRSEKVVKFRNREIQMLVTTTILERGVTIPRSDVFILDADDRLFNAASLVQMAGRAGRSKEDPLGVVVFGSRQWNRAQRKAIRQIREMNRIAARKGYLLPEVMKGKHVG